MLVEAAEEVAAVVTVPMWRFEVEVNSKRNHW